jgi:hypothetical protein
MRSKVISLERKNRNLRVEIDSVKSELAESKIVVSKLRLQLKLLEEQPENLENPPFDNDRPSKSKRDNLAKVHQVYIPKKSIKLLNEFEIDDKDSNIRTFEFTRFDKCILTHHKPAKSCDHLISKISIENPLNITSRKIHSNVIRDIRSSPHIPNQILTVSQDKTM